MSKRKGRRNPVIPGAGILRRSAPAVNRAFRLSDSHYAGLLTSTQVVVSSARHEPHDDLTAGRARRCPRPSLHPDGRAGAGPRRLTPRSVRAEVARRRHDGHRQRAGRPDVDGALPRLREPLRHRGARRDDVDVDAEQGQARRDSLAHRRVREGAAEPRAARGRLPCCRRAPQGRRVGTGRIRDGGGRNRQALGGRGAHHERRRTKRSTPALGARLGRVEHAGAGAPHAARGAHPRSALAHRLEASRLRDLRSGRCGTVDSKGVPVASLHRDAVDARRRSVLPRDVDRHQWRPLLQERAGRRLHDVQRRVGEREHSQQGAAREALSDAVLHPRGRHAVVSRPDRQRARELHQPHLRRLVGPIRMAAVLRRDAADVDAGRRLVSRAGQLEGYGDRERRTAIHVRSGDDLAMAPGFPARLRGADGLDDQGRARGESQSRSRGERPGGKSADRDRCRRRHAGDARRLWAPAIPTGTR